MAGGAGFADRDRTLATVVRRGRGPGRRGRIVYLGGLGHEDLSTHLSSRQEVGAVLGSTGVPVVELRAAVVLGAGSISFEMVRYLTERLPMMVCPRWVNTPTQPIALGDLLDYLVQSTAVAPDVYEIGCTDATTYRQMMDTYAARSAACARRLVVKVPVLTPALSAHWVDFVTPVDATVSHALIESLANEVTVRTRDPDRRRLRRPAPDRRTGHPGRPRHPGRLDRRRRCSPATTAWRRACTPIGPTPAPSRRRRCRRPGHRIRRGPRRHRRETLLVRPAPAPGCCASPSATLRRGPPPRASPGDDPR